MNIFKANQNQRKSGPAALVLFFSIVVVSHAEAGLGDAARQQAGQGGGAARPVAQAIVNPQIPACPADSKHENLPHVEIYGNLYSPAYIEASEVCAKSRSNPVGQGACQKAVKQVKSTFSAYVAKMEVACAATERAKACAGNTAQALACQSQAFAVAAEQYEAAARELDSFASQVSGLKSGTQRAIEKISGSPSVENSDIMKKEQEHAQKALSVGEQYASTRPGQLRELAGALKTQANGMGSTSRGLGSLNSPDGTGASRPRGDDEGSSYCQRYPYAASCSVMAQAPQAPQGGGSGSGSPAGGSGDQSGRSGANPALQAGLDKLKADEKNFTNKLAGNGAAEKDLKKMFDGELGGGLLKEASSPSDLGRTFAGLTGGALVASNGAVGGAPSGAIVVGSASRAPASVAAPSGGSLAGMTSALVPAADGAGSSRQGNGFDVDSERPYSGSSKSGRGGSGGGMDLEPIDTGKGKAGTAGNLAKKVPELPLGSSAGELDKGAADLLGMKASELQGSRQLGKADQSLFARVKAANERVIQRGDLDDSKSIVVEHLGMR